jgi:AcrR family transcriptional regulator
VCAVSRRGKRNEILDVATAYFGEHGYEATKWADVAAAVRIGSTALYHYFDSKLHCLYVIMADALQGAYTDIERISREHEDFVEAVVVAIRSGYELGDQDVLRNRVVVAEQGLLSIPGRSPREEEARERAWAHMRDLEFAWTALLMRGMEQSHIPIANAHLLARAVLGLYNSIWHWHRPDGPMALQETADFFSRRQLAVLSLPPELALADQRLLQRCGGTMGAGADQPWRVTDLPVR